MDEYNKPLRVLFDSIDEARLAEMSERKEEESIHLDFKRMDVSGEPAPDDKENLAIAVSGFANAAGGIILWGVDSKGGTKKGDRSRFQSIAAVTDGERAVIRFHELTGVVTQPPVNGVVHREIKVAGGSVIKTFVPASDGGPHRTSKATGQYYRRAADAFYPMHHHEIADMFGRRLRPRLEIYHSQLERQHAQYRDPAIGDFLLGIRNLGRGIARFPKVVLMPIDIQIDAARHGLDGNGKTNLRREASAHNSRQLAFVGGADDAVHPESELEITRIGILRPTQGTVFSVTIPYTLYAEGMIPAKGTIEFDQGDIAFL